MEYSSLRGCDCFYQPWRILHNQRNDSGADVVVVVVVVGLRRWYLLHLFVRRSFLNPSGQLSSNSFGKIESLMLNSITSGDLIAASAFARRTADASALGAGVKSLFALSSSITFVPRASVNNVPSRQKLIILRLNDCRMMLAVAVREALNRFLVSCSLLSKSLRIWYSWERFGEVPNFRYQLRACCFVRKKIRYCAETNS